MLGNDTELQRGVAGMRERASVCLGKVGWFGVSERPVVGAGLCCGAPCVEPSWFVICGDARPDLEMTEKINRGGARSSKIEIS